MTQAITQPLLEVDDLSMRFQGLIALDSVSFTVHTGSISALIGPNGAGKSTAFNCVSGFYRATSGNVVFDGRSIRGWKPPAISRIGIARTFQNLALCAGLTVIENLMVGAHNAGRTGLLAGALATPRVRRERLASRRRAEEVLELLGIRGDRDRLPGELSYGLQKRVELARALMPQPRLLLLDEPMAGLSRPEKRTMTEQLRTVRDQFGVTFLLVEHDMQVVMSLADEVTVLNFGKKIAGGPPRAVQADPAVIEAYLGVSHAS